MHPLAKFGVELAAAGVLALLVSLLDGPLFDISIVWWGCVSIGLVLVFGGLMIFNIVDD